MASEFVISGCRWQSAKSGLRRQSRRGLTTLKYQRLDAMVTAIGLPRAQLCTYCWNGCERPARRP